jgi:hypothetical protein
MFDDADGGAVCGAFALSSERFGVLDSLAVAVTALLADELALLRVHVRYAPTSKNAISKSRRIMITTAGETNGARKVARSKTDIERRVIWRFGAPRAALPAVRPPPATRSQRL